MSLPVRPGEPATIATRCVIAGGGPAGMMLGYLLARRGIDVVVLEKHEDFFRDFRGDTVHPSTLDALETLGLLDDFLKLTKNRQPNLAVQIAGERLPGPDFRFITTHNKFLVLVPQWDFLNFLADHAKQYPGFHLMMKAEAFDLVRDDKRVLGLRATTPQGDVEILADVVVGCDGRHSTVRERAGLPAKDLGAPIDVLWLRVDKEPGDGTQTFGSVDAGRIVVLIDRDDYWQCAYVIPKGSYPQLQERGIESFRANLAAAGNFTVDRLAKLSWEDVSLLSVSVDRLLQWAQPGLVCIGDAAHTMSPVFGVGINLAVQDAIATANILTPALRAGVPTLDRLNAVQRRRDFPTKFIQRMQVFVHKRVLALQLANTDGASLQRAKRYIKPALFFMRFLAAQMVGVGPRPERPNLG